MGIQFYFKGTIYDLQKCKNKSCVTKWKIRHDGKKRKGNQFIVDENWAMDLIEHMLENEIAHDLFINGKLTYRPVDDGEAGMVSSSDRGNFSSTVDDSENIDGEPVDEDHQWVDDGEAGMISSSDRENFSSTVDDSENVDGEPVGEDHQWVDDGEAGMVSSSDRENFSSTVDDSENAVGEPVGEDQNLESDSETDNEPRKESPENLSMRSRFVNFMARVLGSAASHRPSM
jgi:hypothetical protein